MPALFAAPHPLADLRDNFVVASDAQSVFAYFLKAAATGTTEYEQDLDANGIEDGLQYNRSVVGPAVSGPPGGTITPADAQVAFAQFKLAYSC